MAMIPFGLNNGRDQRPTSAAECLWIVVSRDCRRY